MAPQTESTSRIAIVKQADIPPEDVAGMQNDGATAPTENTKAFQLDALKAIRESAYNRWEKRRTSEWHLSISIWTALAAFIGIVVTKGVSIDRPPFLAGCIIGVGLIVSVDSPGLSVKDGRTI